MDVQILTYIIVGAAFALYIGIALWSKASSTGEFYIAGGVVLNIIGIIIIALISVFLLPYVIS